MIKYPVRNLLDSVTYPEGYEQPSFFNKAEALANPGAEDYFSLIYNHMRETLDLKVSWWSSKGSVVWGIN